MTISYLCENNFTNLFAMNINQFGFMRVAAASPKVKVADCDYNISEIKSMIDEALKEHVQILCFPELSITSYTCADLFFQTTLQKKAISSLINLADSFPQYILPHNTLQLSFPFPVAPFLPSTLSQS
jgi:predicted amidohydrolase